ncbi:MAG: HDOD domain-containing protein [Planctomycetota bacterium]|nr:HDOD domain-containing protein [Planctomycetota bacterium]
MLIGHLESFFGCPVKVIPTIVIFRAYSIVTDFMADIPSKLDRLVERCSKLYTLPVVAVRVIQLTSSPTVDVRALKDCIENDPALTCKVLRVVNSSLFGLSRIVTDLNQALALLGTNPLKLLVLGFSLPDNLFVGVNGDILRRYWHRTLIKSVAAREISQSVCKQASDDAFIAGLLQDLGVLALLQEHGEVYAALLDYGFSKSDNLAALERQALGFDHFELSARLLEEWCLPRELVAAVRAGSNEERIAELPVVSRSLPRILQLADLIANVLAENRSDLLETMLQAAQRDHHFAESKLTELVAALQTKVDQLAEVLNLELPSEHDYNRILAEAHQQLSSVATEIASETLRWRSRGLDSTDETALLAELTQLANEADRATRPRKQQPRPAGSAEAAEPAAKKIKTADSLGGSSTRFDGPVTESPGLPIEKYAAAPKASNYARGARAATLTPDQLALDALLESRVNAAVGACRQARAPLSLLLIHVDKFDELVAKFGIKRMDPFVRALQSICRQVEFPGAYTLPREAADLALLVPDCDRRQAVELANELAGKARLLSGSVGRGDNSMIVLTLSVGVASLALPPKNFPASDLMQSAERCLSGATLSGGNSIKSLEIY